MRIRSYTPADEEQIITLWALCGLVVPQNDPRKDIQRKINVDPELFLVGEEGDSIIASVMGGYEGHRGWINYLAVAPSAQRAGHGRAMMAAIEGLLSARGCPKINLQVRRNNADIIGFYTSIGFLDDNVIGLGKRIDAD